MILNGGTHTDDSLAQPETLNGLVDRFRGNLEAAAIITVDQSGSIVTRTYPEIAEDISRLAVGLTRSGLGDGKMVMLWAENCAEWVITYLASAVAGSVVIPLDDQMSAAELSTVVRHCRPACVFTSVRHLPVLDACDAYTDHCFLLDGDQADAPSWRKLCADDLTDRIPDSGNERVASLLYTSGTTGPPKAVPLTHANLMSNVRDLIGANLISSEDRVLVPLPLHHAYPATVGMLTTLARGAALILPSGISGPELTTAANRARATVLLGVPRLYAEMVSSIEATVASSGYAVRALFPLLMGACIVLRRGLGIRAGRLLFRRIHRRVGTELRILASGGARLEPALARKLEAMGWEVFTGYGLTETSPVVTFNKPGRKRLGSQGVPLTGVELDFEKTGDEPYGEILVKGPNVFSGYRDNDAATRSAFTPTGWFRTGDLGYLDRDGYLHVVGRKKELIVLADGKNVSPEEVEQVYEASPFIHEAAVLERNGKLVALIVPEDEAVRQRGAMREEALLRDQVQKAMQTLPSHQRIAEYRLTRRSLPRTRLGKLRRHLLPDIFETEAQAVPTPPPAELNAEDKRLLQSPTVNAAWLWLQRRFPGITINSSPQLDLGIDSLKWVAISSELEEELGVVLSAEALSRVLTIRDLLCAIGAAPRESHITGEPGAGRTDRYLLTPGPPLRVFRWLLLTLNRLVMHGCFRLRVRGSDRLPSEGPFVITPNHASYLDPLAVAAALPHRLLAGTCWAGWARTMHKGPVFRAVSRATRVFPVDPDQDLGGGVRLGALALRDGRILVWFPEGRRSPDGNVQQFQRGIGVLLQENPVRAVPVRVHGSFEAWPANRLLPRLLRPITVVFGRPQTVDRLLERGEGDGEPAKISNALERCVKRLTL